MGDVAWEQGDSIAARTYWSEALPLTRQVGAQGWFSATLGDLGMMAFHEGDYATARSQITESLALYRTLHTHHLVALALCCLGAVARAQGDIALARTCYEEKLAFWRDIGNRTGIAATLAEMGALALQEGDHVQAHALFDQALALRRELGDNAGVAASRAHLGDLASAQGEHERAATFYRDALDLLHPADDRVVAASCLEGLAAIASAAGHPERAARLYGAGATLRRGTFVLNVWDERVARERQVEAVRAALGEAAFAAAWGAGQAMTPEQAIADALDGPQSAPGILLPTAGIPQCVPARPRRSRRERQAWALEQLRAAGPLTPQAYARALAVSVDTALRDLQDLVAQGALQAAGTTRDRRYVLAAGPAIPRTAP
jgi:Tfp pilus assembly protein PilF